MGIADIRDAFNAVALEHGIRCTGALLHYCDKDGKPDGPRTHQQLTFNCVKSNDNTTVQYTSDLLPPGASVMAAAAAAASKAIGT